MKKIKQKNRMVIYQSLSLRDQQDYRCFVGNYNIYLKEELQCYPLSMAYAEFYDIESMQQCEEIISCYWGDKKK